MYSETTENSDIKEHLCETYNINPDKIIPFRLWLANMLKEHEDIKTNVLNVSTFVERKIKI